MRRSFTRSYTDAIGDSLRITNRARWPREHITLSHRADAMSCSPQQVLFAIFANPLRTLRSKALRPQSTQNHRKEREESHAANSEMASARLICYLLGFTSGQSRTPLTKEP